jgi:nucleoside-diphosphate-sugar epimerase
MKIFVTGATGYIGKAVVQELTKAGHTVSALARNDEAAKALQARGIQPHRGGIDNLASLSAGARAADGAIHLAYMHGISQVPLAGRLRVIMGGLPGGIVSRFMAVAAEADRKAIDAIGTTFKGSHRPLVTVFGTLGLAAATGTASQTATEDNMPDPRSPGISRARNEDAVQRWAAQGVRATIIRLAPTVHGPDDTGLIPQLIGAARKSGTSAYIGSGNNRWPAVHRDDAARLLRLALEKGVAGARYHGVAEDGIAFKAIADLIGQTLGVPVECKTPRQAAGQLSYLANFVGVDNPTSSVWTQAQLDWRPKEADLFSDLNTAGYFNA